MRNEERLSRYMEEVSAKEVEAKVLSERVEAVAKEEKCMRPSTKEVAVDEKSTEVKSNCEPYIPKRSIIKITINTQFFSFSDLQEIRLSNEKVSVIGQ